jgi:undecaprenyl diphosphate synthase
MENDRVPRHIVIIPDGNRRWAKSRMMKPWEGHIKAGSHENLFPLLKKARGLNIEYLSLWGFSTENWKRDKKEVDILMNLFTKTIKKSSQEFHKEKIRFRHLGRKDRIPKELLIEIEKLEKETSDYNDFNFQLCIDYGGRDEIIRAVNKLVKKGVEINEENLAKSLDTAEIPDPDLIIRTGGEKRLSGIMPFQSDYAELYFTDKYFPDFNADDLGLAVEDFSARKRNFGGN